MSHMSAMVELAAFNPFNGVSPSFGPFTGLLKSKVGVFLGLAWAIGFCYTAYNLIVAVATLARTRKGGYGDNLDETKTNVLQASIATAALAALPVIYAVLTTTTK